MSLSTQYAGLSAGKISVGVVPDLSSEYAALDATGYVDSAKVKPKPQAYGWRQITRDSWHSVLGWSPDGATIWASDLTSTAGRWLAYSTDQMHTWTQAVAPDPTYAPGSLHFTAAGSMIVNCAGKIYRSTDSGLTFTMVLDLGQPTISMLQEGFTEDPGNPGHLYVGQYGDGNVAGYMPGGVVNVYASTDDGVTWAVHSSFPAMGDNPTSISGIRHIHVLTFLPSGFYCCTGDDSNAYSSGPGIWMWSGSAWVRQSPNTVSQSSPFPDQRWRTTWLAERNGWLYWARDSGGATAGEVGKAPVGNITAASFVQVATLPTGSFFHAVQADGSILFGGSAEDGAPSYGGNHNADQYLRLWVLDTNDQVTEVWRALRHPAAVGTSHYGQFSTGILLNPASGDLLLNPINVDYLDAPGASFAGESILGRVDHGAATIPSGDPGPGMRQRNQRFWSTTATVTGPTTTVSTASGAVVPDMQLSIPVSHGASYLVTWSMTVCSGSSSTATVNAGLSLESASVASDDVRTAECANTADFRTLSGSRIWTPSNPGLRTVALAWWVGTAGQSAEAVKLERKITVVELAS